MKQYVVDAFTDRVFHGNQAAVCILESWPEEELMMDITRENNLCGHATLGTAYMLFRFFETDAKMDCLCFRNCHCRP